MKNQPKLDVSLQPPRFKIHSLMVSLIHLPFEEFLITFENLKFEILKNVVPTANAVPYF